MNYTQFYRSPLNSYRNEEREEYASPRPVTLVKKGENKNSRRNRYYSVINSSNSKSSNDNNEELSENLINKNFFDFNFQIYNL